MLLRLAVRTSVLALAVLSAATWSGHAQTDMWSAADSTITRMPPSAFPSLPTSIQREIAKRGCRIPQAFGPHGANVIRGHFAKQGQTDWAVLCSKDGVSTILIFWSGSPSRVDSLAPVRDQDYLQETEPGKIGYSRRISTIAPKGIRYVYGTFGEGASPPFPLDHDGIDDYFVEKASVIHFRHRGKWVRLVGAD